MFFLDLFIEKILLIFIFEFFLEIDLLYINFFCKLG